MSLDGFNEFLNTNGAQQFQQPNGGFIDPVLFHAFATSMRNGNVQHQCLMPPPVINSFLVSPHPCYDSKMMQRNAPHFNQFAPKTQQLQQPPRTPIKVTNKSDEQLSDQYNSMIFRTPSSSMSNETRALCELQRKALRGCESGAKISEAHGKRPYFKKIDLLCNRMKTDLCVTDKAVININSHGVAWAIKDFIFVFNRIINAWVILRDYFYSKSEGMQCVNQSVDPNFYNDFVEWQNATIKLSSSLVQTFENLHSRDQRNGNRKADKASGSNHNSPANKNQGDFHKIFDPLIVENSEQAQREGGYLKSAVYKPLSSSEESSPADTPSSTHDFSSLKNMFNELLSENISMDRNEQKARLFQRGVGGSPHSKTSLTNKFGLISNDSSDSDLGGIIPMHDKDSFAQAADHSFGFSF